MRTIEVDDIGRLRTFQNDLISDFLADGKAWEPHLQDVFKHFIQPDDHVIDVGAYIGIHTIYMAGLCPSGSVTAFEPNPESRPLLYMNLQQNRVHNARVYHCGLSDQNEAVEIGWSKKTNRGSTGLEGGIFPVLEEHRPTRPMRVEVKTLDSLGFDRVDLIKLDVEGYETRVLSGASETIARFKPTIVFECWGGHGNVEAGDEEFSDPKFPFCILDSLGYKVEKIHGPDFLATHPDRV